MATLSRVSRFAPCLLACAAALLGGSVSAMAQDTGKGPDDLRAAIAGDLPGLMALYRDFHQNPELSFQEVKTAAKLADAARKAGFTVTEGVGKTGVVAVLKNGPGPVVLVRTDMDGLPVIEQTGLPFASKARGTSTAGVESGIMHACGHDTHMTTWIEVARLLSARRGQWSGTLVMIGQPAEEVGLGAHAMLEDGLFTRFPKPDHALAFHDNADLLAGTIGWTPGWAMANVDSVDVIFHGVGGHGAYPWATKDPIVMASSFVMRVQTLVSREHDAMDPAVVTVGSFHAGAKHNIIPDEAHLQITVRSYGDASRKQLLDGISRIAKAEAEAAGVAPDKAPEITVMDPYTHSTFNTPDFTEQLGKSFIARFGADRAAPVRPSMVGEDFGDFLRAMGPNGKATIFWVGGVYADKLAAAKASGQPLPPLHSSLWAPQADKVIATAAEAMTASVLSLMPKG